MTFLNKCPNGVCRSLEEAKYFLFLLAVPFSYVVAAICNCCCGVDRLPEINFEMDGVDKEYSQVIFKKNVSLVKI